MLSQALDLTLALNGELLIGSCIWIEDAGEPIAAEKVLASSHVGLDCAGAEAVALQWHFRVKGSK